MKTTPKASLLVSTYEMPRHLRLVCAGLERQSVESKDLEVFICDDGSGEETANIIKEFQTRAPFPVYHLWQENQGFRKCRILNRALKDSLGEVMVFLDGDTIPHRDYIRDHLEQQEKGYYLAGRRVMLGQKFSDWLTPKKVISGFFDQPRFRLCLSTMTDDTEHFQRSIRVPFNGLRKKLGMTHIDDLIGCNYSVSRKALLAINGFDEAYEGYGREDTDVELRLQNLGLKIKSMKGLALQFHIWHPRRIFTPANDDRLNEVKRSGKTWCELGLEKSPAYRPIP